MYPSWRRNLFTSIVVMPSIPSSVRASLTSSTLKGLMIASIFFMSWFPANYCQRSIQNQPLFLLKPGGDILARRSVGHVAPFVLDHAPCPVLLVRQLAREPFPIAR